MLFAVCVELATNLLELTDCHKTFGNDTACIFACLISQPFWFFKDTAISSHTLPHLCLLKSRMGLDFVNGGVPMDTKPVNGGHQGPSSMVERSS